MGWHVNGAGVASPWLEVRVGASTSTGRVRRLNEDAYACAGGLFVVADGMGGHAAGDVASALCVDVLTERLGGRREVSRADLEDALTDANRAILQHAEQHTESAGLGTTVTGLLLVDGPSGQHWLVFNIGDSRVYNVTDRLRQLTVDHSELQELVLRGEVTADEARHHPRRHVVTRSLGGHPQALVDYWQLPATPGDRFLVCSDGLVDELTDAEVESHLVRELDPQRCADALVEAAVQAGGRDNVTVLVIDHVGRDARSATGSTTADDVFAEHDLGTTTPRTRVGRP
jgi:PPM family protein phosphatase